MTITISAPASVSVTPTTFSPSTDSTSVGTIRVSGVSLGSGTFTVTASDPTWLAATWDITTVVPQLWVSDVSNPLVNGGGWVQLGLGTVGGGRQNASSELRITFTASPALVTVEPATVVADSPYSGVARISAGSSTGSFTLTGTMSLSGSPSAPLTINDTQTVYVFEVVLR